MWKRIAQGLREEFCRHHYEKVTKGNGASSRDVVAAMQTRVEIAIPEHGITWQKRCCVCILREGKNLRREKTIPHRNARFESDFQPSNADLLLCFAPASGDVNNNRS